MISRPLTTLTLSLGLVLLLSGCAHPSREDYDFRAYAPIIETARLQLGVPYRRGGSSPGAGFDCSGFVQWVFWQHGLDLARTTGEQTRQGRRVKKKALKPGDLVFFSSSRWGRIGHVGIYVGRGRFIHASSGAGEVKTDSLSHPYWSRHFKTARRLIP